MLKFSSDLERMRKKTSQDPDVRRFLCSSRFMERGVVLLIANFCLMRSFAFWRNCQQGFINGHLQRVTESIIETKIFIGAALMLWLHETLQRDTDVIQSISSTEYLSNCWWKSEGDNTKRSDPCDFRPYSSCSVQLGPSRLLHMVLSEGSEGHRAPMSALIQIEGSPQQRDRERVQLQTLSIY